MGVFNPNNVLFRTLARMVDIVGISMLWLLLCAPVITAGPATAALYHTVKAIFYDRDDEVFRRYLRSFRQNLKVGIPAGLICIGLGAVLLLGREVVFQHQQTPLQLMGCAVYSVLLVIPMGICCYLFPLLGRFTFTLKELFLTAFQFTLAHLPTTVVLVLLMLEGVGLMLQYVWTAFFVPTLLMALASLFLERVFKKHL